jgi:HTH-type transcriptional regulator, sugar sensing transcriptional regulator
MDLELLKEIGLTDGEIRVYLALFKLGSTSTGPLIKESKVHASKVYPILDRLIEKGLVSFVKEGKKTIYTANPATTIISYLNKLQSKIGQQKKSATNLIEELTKLKSLNKTESETTVFKGSKGLKNAYNIAIAELKKGEGCYAMFLPKVSNNLLPFFKRFITEVSKKKANHYLLYNEPSPEIDLIKHLPRTHVRIDTPHGYQSPAEMCVYGDYTIISTSGGKEYLTILIKDKIIANSFKNQFKAIWNQKTRTLRGKEGVETVFNEALGSKEIRFIGGNWGIVKYHQEFFEKWNRAREKRKVMWLDLIDTEFLVESKKKPKSLEHYQAKILPEQVNSPGVIFIYGDKVATIIWKKETIINVIESKEVVDHYRKYFDYLWEQKVKTYSGKEGVKNLLNTMLDTKSKEYFAYGGPQKSHNLLGNPFWKDFHERRIKKKIAAKLVFHSSLGWWGDKLNEYPLTKVRITDKYFEELTETVICGNKVAIIVWLDHPFGILMEEPLAAKSYQKFFELIWEK